MKISLGKPTKMTTPTEVFQEVLQRGQTNYATLHYYSLVLQIVKPHAIRQASAQRGSRLKEGPGQQQQNVI